MLRWLFVDIVLRDISILFLFYVLFFFFHKFYKEFVFYDIMLLVTTLQQVEESPNTNVCWVPTVFQVVNWALGWNAIIKMWCMWQQNNGKENISNSFL